MTTRDLCIDLIQQNPDYQYSKTFVRHLRDLGQNPDGSKNPDNPGLPEQYRFNEKLAQLYLDITETLRHSKGPLAGQCIILEPWQRASFAIAFGWEKTKPKFGKSPEMWVRRFNTLLFYMARKNGKTLIAAGLSLVDTLIRPDAGGELVCIATKSDQSLLALNQVADMVLSHLDLKKLYSKRGNKYTSKVDGTTLYNLGRDSTKQDGLNVSVLISDECHAMADSNLIDVCTSSMGARTQPVHFMISTAGFNLGSPLVDEIDHARKVLNDTTRDEDFFAFLAEPKLTDDRYSLETLKKSNPNIGVSVSEEFLLKQAQEAQARPDKRVNYFTKYLNIFVNSSEEFIDIQDWKGCRKDLTEAGYKRLYPKVKQINIGFDLSVNDDVTAINVMYIKDDDSVHLKWEFFLPEKKIQLLAKKYKAPLEKWQSQGHLSTTRGDYIDYDYIYERIKFHIEEADYESIPVYVFYDPFKAKSVIAALENEMGFQDYAPVNQGFMNSSEPLSLLSTYVKQKKLTYCNNPMMNWMISNVEIMYDSYGNQKLSKVSQYRKIDGVSAMTNNFWGLIPIIREEESDEMITFI